MPVDLFPSTPAVDLSRLPPPAIVETPGFEAVYADLLAEFQSLLPTFDATVESDPVVKLLQAFAWRELLIRQLFADNARQLMVAYATGTNLDHLGALLDVSRLEIVPANALTGAAAIMESDAAFRERIILAPDGYTVAGPRSAYIYHARSADPDIADASAISPAPGQVQVTILTHSNGGQATEPLLATVLARVNADTIRPLTDQVSVVGAVFVDFNVSATLWIENGPDADLILQNAIDELDDLLSGSHRLGRDIPRSLLIATLHVPGVARVELTSPVADVIVPDSAVARATSYDITQGFW